MAMLKDSIVTGSLRVTDIVLTDGVQASVIKAPTSSGSTTYGVGSNGQVLKSNGTTVYWGTDDNSTSYVASSQGTGNSGKFLTVNSSGQVICSNFSDLVTVRDAGSLSANGATVTVPAGYYSSQVTKSISNGTVVASVSSNSGGSASMAATGFTASSSATNYYITLSTSAGSVKAKAAGGTAGYITSSTTNETAATSVAVSGNGNKLYIPAGSATTPATTITKNPTISVGSDGKITASVSGTQNVTATVSSGYVASGTAGTITVSGSATQQMTVKAATTYTPATTNQTIAAGTYLTGAQTIKGDANLVAGNIVSGVTIFGVTGTYSIPAAAGHSF